MLKSVWFYVFVAVVVGAAGGWYFYDHQTAQVLASSTPPASAPTPAVAQDDLNKKRKESIGSIKDLKEVPLGDKP